ncbi:MAG: hypothetical protein R2772_08200 [Chitinophagales bacterium]
MESSHINEIAHKSVDSSSNLVFTSLDNIAKEDLLYHIENVEIKNKELKVVVQYGGGCIKPHLFELQTDGAIVEDGMMHFFLLHKSRNDMCKALIIEELSFDLSLLYDLESELLKGIVLNKDFKLSL